MSPQPMVAWKSFSIEIFISLAFSGLRLTSGDPEPGQEIVDDSKHCRLPVERHPEGLNAAIERHANDQGHIQPVHVLIPIGLGDG